MKPVSEEAVMAIRSYQSQAETLVKDYLLADPLIPYTSVLCGIFACKMEFVMICLFYEIPFGKGFVRIALLGFGHIISNTSTRENASLPLFTFFILQAYELMQWISSFYFKTYAGLTKIQQLEWNNRGISTLHAIFITVMSLYLVFFSELYSDQPLAGLVPFRSSSLSTFALGVSTGYFISDIAMILWLYPSLGGIEYVLHHLLSLIAVSYSMLSGEGQLYAYMVLISEATTTGINLRWYLDTAGMKRSSAYLLNGIVIFFTWLVARILLFVYVFYCVYLHYDQIQQMHTFGVLLVFVVPPVLFIMNLMWFGKITKGLKKALAKKQ